MTDQPLLDRLLTPADPAPAWLEPRREAARAFLSRNGLPTTRDEAWRYTSLNRLTSDELDAFAEQADPAAVDDITSAHVDDLAGAHGGPRIVVVNGRYRDDLSTTADAPAGVTFGSLAAADPQVVPVDGPRPDGFVALNQVVADDAALVVVDADTVVDAPLHVVHVSIPVDGTPVSHPATVIRLGGGSTATVIESWVGAGGPVLVNAVTSIDVADGASLTLHRIQSEHDRSIHFGATSCRLGTSAKLQSVSIATGADVARTALDVVLAGDDAEATLDGLYLPHDRQHHDNVITVQHAADRGRSHQRFRGIIDDQGRGSFTGHIIVDVDTAGNDAVQSNHSLLLTSRAESDSRPWLEILADDVQCNHGATVGRLDDAALFYLRSRGIPLREARRILIEAFASAITEKIDIESLRDHLAATVKVRRARPESEE